MKKRQANVKPLQRLSKAKFWLGSLGVVLLAVVTVGWLPNWQVSQTQISGKDKAALENEYRKTAIQALGGLFFLVTAGLTLKNIRLTEDKNVTDRFAKAVEMLADEKLEVRLGGVYSLERIARDSRKDHPVVMEVLTAFIRKKTQSGEYGKPNKPRQEVQSALTVIGRRETTFDSHPLVLSGAYLKGAELRKARLEGADLEWVNLENATLSYARLEGTRFRYAHLQGAILQGAYLQGADLQEARLEGANLSQTILESALLCSANLEGASLSQTILEGTFLCSANLEGAVDFTEKQLAQAKLCCTFLPEGVDLRLRNRNCKEMSINPEESGNILLVPSVEGKTFYVLRKLANGQVIFNRDNWFNL
ncbi:pentapeptide repeat-containing protein [Leptolyngbya iicbica]|uniref:Pentapeptide repeat-containing protein n=2 Tax=Cyanophyceae TaxID=3028117 RepID=A0A4Q7E5F2_9CYAN|nr:pentapeptide repeat-containing protein [Leptolyngbya sp. LK]RZM77180.1 pentapeptide repeat-containing protein [Leptolyngbya sp. LK]